MLSGCLLCSSIFCSTARLFRFRFSEGSLWRYDFSLFSVPRLPTPPTASKKSLKKTHPLKPTKIPAGSNAFHLVHCKPILMRLILKLQTNKYLANANTQIEWKYYETTRHNRGINWSFQRWVFDPVCTSHGVRQWHVSNRRYEYHFRGDYRNAWWCSMNEHIFSPVWSLALMTFSLFERGWTHNGNGERWLFRVHQITASLLAWQLIAFYRFGSGLTFCFRRLNHWLLWEFLPEFRYCTGRIAMPLRQILS